jgi:hypothetical protein
LVASAYTFGVSTSLVALAEVFFLSATATLVALEEVFVASLVAFLVLLSFFLARDELVSFLTGLFSNTF